MEQTRFSDTTTHKELPFWIQITVLIQICDWNAGKPSEDLPWDCLEFTLVRVTASLVYILCCLISCLIFVIFLPLNWHSFPPNGSFLWISVWKPFIASEIQINSNENLVLLSKFRNTKKLTPFFGWENISLKMWHKLSWHLLKASNS